MQDGFWTVKARVWSTHHPATCLSGLVSGFVWVRPWPKWSFSSSCPGSCSALPSLYHQDTLCPVWRASLVSCCSQPNTRWTLRPDQAGRGSARCVRAKVGFFFLKHIHYTPIIRCATIRGHIIILICYEWSGQSETMSHCLMVLPLSNSRGSQSFLEEMTIIFNISVHFLYYFTQMLCVMWIDAPHFVF